ncbi:ankyrin repeat domain-containing protein 26-like isoform X3 [Notamacropus eugenii]|uniref:ankyrin repeat domain-containing protein 26-like isoform X3 n=1 Tax=Notamacropus eugenii TaxID=9315 RepID=UPI003B678831
MKKIFRFRSRRELSPSRSSFPPRRDSGARPFGPDAGYVIRLKDLGKIHKAAAIGDVAKVQQLLLLRKASVDDLDKENRTPLHLACANGYPDVVSLLVERNCKLNMRDNDSQTPLIKAVQCQQKECATILLEHGADPNLVDTDNNTALHYAAFVQNTAIAAELLRHKTDIEAKNKEGYTPLLLAIRENNQDMVDLLLKNGANVNASDKSKRTALMIAVSGEPTGIVSLLLEYDIDLSCQDTYGWTAEEYAIVSGHSIHRQLINQYGTQKALNQPLSPQTGQSERASDPEFTLGGPAIDQQEIQESPVQTSGTRISGKVVEESSLEESISRLSDKLGADDSWPTTDEEELDFSTKKLPKANLTKIINASQQIRKNIDEKSSTVNTEHRAFLGHSQSESEKEDMTVTLPKPSLRAQSSPHSVHPSLGSFSRSSQEMTTLLGVNKEESTESEEEEKEDGILIDNGTGEQTAPKTPYLPNEVQAHSTSVNCAVRKDLMSALGLEEEEDAESSWDSECATESLPKGSTKHISASTNPTIKDNISVGREDVFYIPSFMNGSRNFKMNKLKDTRSIGMPVGSVDYFETHPNLKPIQPTIEMKDSFTNQEAEKGVKGKQKSHLIEEFGLDDADDIDDASDWDSTSTSQKNESYRSSKDLNFNGNSPCQSLPVTKNQSGPTEFGKIPLKEDEAAETGFRVVILEEKPVPQKQCEPQLPLKKEDINMNLTQESEFKGSTEEGQESFHKSDLEQDKVQMDRDDVDDLTQSSDTATEDYDLPPLNCKNILLLIEHLSVDCKDPVSLLKIQDAVLRYERSVELKKGHCTLLGGKVKSLENKITGLQEELSETREMKSQLEHQKVESDRELCSLRFTLKQEEVKRVTAEMLFEKIREQLRRKEEQCSKEVELKQQLEFTLRTLDLELKTVRNHLKQVEEERNDTQRQLFQELRARASQVGILNNPLWKQKEIEAPASKMIQTSEVPDSNEKEKYLLHENQTLQEEVAMLKLELDTVKIKDQEKENQYTEENEVLKEKNNELQKELQLNEEALTKTISKYSGQVNVLTTENAMLNSKLENAKQNRDRLETEIESYRSRLTSAIDNHERSQTSKLDLEHTFQRERDEWLRLQDKLNHDLSRLRENNGVLSQELSKAESKANSLENELYHVRDSLREKTLILESTQRELNQAQHKAKELEHTNQLENEKLNKYIGKYESIQERLAQIQSENMLLQQQLEDVQNKGIIKEKVLSDAQVQFIDLFNKLRADTEKQVLMVEERNKELISECERLREQMCKHENEKAERETTVRKLQEELATSLTKQSMTEASLEVTSLYQNDFEDKKKQLQKEIDQMKSKLNTEREKLKKLIELKQSLENRLEQEMKRNEELQKDLIGLKNLLKTTKKKLREYEKGDVAYEGGLKQTHSEMDRQINRLKNKIEDLTQQLEAASSECKQLESINRSLQEELFSMKILQKNCDKLEGNKRQLEEEVVNLKHYLEITKLEHNQIEQYKHEIEERARQEIVEKLKEVNLFLQTQAASRENLEQLRENNNASIRNQMEHRIRDLESELYKMKNSRQDSTEAEIKRYRQLYSEELKIRKSLSNKLDRTTERLAEVSARLLNEKQKNKVLINSFAASPVLEPSHIGNINTSMFLSRSLIPRGNLVCSAGNTVSSKSRVEAYMAKMQQELEENITRELDEATAKLESRS